MPSKSSRFQASRMQGVQRVKSASINAFRRAGKTRFFRKNLRHGGRLE